MIYVLIVFAPLLGAILAGFFGRMLGEKPSMYITSGLMVLAAVLSWVGFLDVTQILSDDHAHPTHVELLTWIRSDDFAVNWALQIDSLTAVMLVVVNTVSCLVHVYSIGYMSHDPHKARFFSYLSLFTFALTGGNEATAALLERINRDGRIYLTQTRVDDALVIRFQAGQFETTEADVMMAHGVITEIARTLE